MSDFYDEGVAVEDGNYVDEACFFALGGFDVDGFLDVVFYGLVDAFWAAGDGGWVAYASRGY